MFTIFHKFAAFLSPNHCKFIAFGFLWESMYIFTINYLLINQNKLSDYYLQPFIYFPVSCQLQHCLYCHDFGKHHPCDNSMEYEKHSLFTGDI